MMYSTRAHNTVSSSQQLPSVRVARRYQQMRPFFFRLGPVSLCTVSVLLIALMALLYLSQLGQAEAANQQLQSIHAQQATLTRENQDLVDTIAQEQSPAFIEQQAKQMGMVLADQKSTWLLVIPHMQHIPSQDQNIQP